MTDANPETDYCGIVVTDDTDELLTRLRTYVASITAAGKGEGHPNDLLVGQRMAVCAMDEAAARITQDAATIAELRAEVARLQVERDALWKHCRDTGGAAVLAALKPTSNERDG